MEITSASLCYGPLAFRYWNARPKETRDNLIWASTRLPGDRYNGCDGIDHTVQKVEKVYSLIEEERDEDDPTYTYLVRGRNINPMELSTLTNWCLIEVDLYGTDGSVHGTMGKCASPPIESINPTYSNVIPP